MKDVVKNPNKVADHPNADKAQSKVVNQQCTAADKEACADQSLTRSSAITELTDANFLSTISSPKLTLVDFYTGW